MHKRLQIKRMMRQNHRRMVNLAKNFGRLKLKRTKEIFQYNLKVFNILSNYQIPDTMWTAENFAYADLYSTAELNKFT